MNYAFSPHQQKQVEIINKLEEQIKSSSVGFSTVSPVSDYENDTRICLTSVHLPDKQLVDQVQSTLIEPLKDISPDFFYYPPDSLHMTIKNIRVINDPPHFTEDDKEKAKEIFSSTIPQHKKFKVYFYRLLLFPNNLALIGTTDPELDNIFLELDKKLNEAGIADDKKYMNSQYFLSNMTLARFNNQPSDKFLQKVAELSQSLTFEPYTVDSVTLLTCTPVFMKRNIIHTWELGN